MWHNIYVSRYNFPFLVKVMVQIRGSQGQMVNAEQLDFQIVNEGFSVYKLSDGKILKIRVVLAEVYRLDEKDEVTGRAGYFIKSMPVVSIEDAKK
jgi:hypothetical protein